MVVSDKDIGMCVECLTDKDGIIHKSGKYPKVGQRVEVNEDDECGTHYILVGAFEWPAKQ